MGRLSATARLAFLALAAAGCAGATPQVPVVVVPFTGVAAPPSPPLVVRPPLEQPGRYRVAFTTGREHGCSLSYAVSHSRGEYVLELEADGRAELLVSSTTDTVFGSRMLTSSADAPVRDSTVAVSRWKGEAQESPGRVDVTLYDAGAACGVPGAPRRCPGPTTLKLACVFGRADVSPAAPDLAADVEAVLVPVDVLRCSGAPTPLGDDDPAFAERLTLSRSAPLAMAGRNQPWRAEEALFLEGPQP